MIKDLLSFFKSKKRDIRVLVKNIFSVSFIKVFDYLLPVVVIPYIVRIIGVQKFGMVNVAQSLINYFLIFVSFGFNYTVTQQVSINRKNNKRLNELFIDTLFIKSFFMILSFLLVLILVLIIKEFRKEFLLIMFSSLMLIGETFFPIWLFQGLEILDYVAKIIIPIRLIFTAFIFIFVKKPEDYVLIPLLYAGGPIFAAIYSLIFVKKRFKFLFIKPSIKRIRFLLKDSWGYFLSRASITFYNSTNIIIIKFVGGNYYSGIYAAASKFIKLMKRLLQPLYISVFPYFNNPEKMNKESDDRLNKYMFYLSSLFILLISIIIFIIADKLIFIFFGKNFVEAVLIFRILLLTIVFYHMAAYIGAAVLIPNNLKNYFNYSVIFSSFLHLIILSILIILNLATIVNIAIVVVFTQLLIFLIRIYPLFKNRNLLKKVF